MPKKQDILLSKIHFHLPCVHILTILRIWLFLFNAFGRDHPQLRVRPRHPEGYRRQPLRGQNAPRAVGRLQERPPGRRPEAYHAALLHKQALSRQVDAFFASLQVDFLLLPVAFSTAPSIDAPQEAFTAGRALVNLFSVAGVPTLVVPGELTAGGMPLGIQLVGPALSERLLLDVGTAYETTYGTFPTPPLASA